MYYILIHIILLLSDIGSYQFQSQKDVAGRMYGGCILDLRFKEKAYNMAK